MYNTSLSHELNSTTLQNLIKICNERRGSHSQNLIADLMIKALQNLMDEDAEHEHIYLKNTEVPQIELFAKLIEKFPFVKYSQIIANSAILDAIGNESEVTIMDIGIGQGVQMMHVLQAANNKSTLKTVNIIGIEPFADALNTAQENINNLKQLLNFQVNFYAINQFIEEINFSELVTGTCKLIVNASLALHHIQSAEKRNTVLADIKSLNPFLFLLIEPNVNHMEVDINKRFEHCYNHYYNLFLVIDKLPIEDNEKYILKRFFGREIEDVLGKNEWDRYEKHEMANTWIQRLQKAGFALNPHILHSPVQSELGVNIAIHENSFIGFTHDTETILAVISAQ